MPSSAAEGKLFFKDWFYAFADQIHTVLDVGPGSGVYSEIIRSVEPNTELHAVEIFEPYIERFNLTQKYTKIFTQNVMDFQVDGATYDLIILGDVLEHLERADAFNVWWYLRGRTKFIWLSLPVAPFAPWFRGYGHLGQPEFDYAENKYEKHLYEWDIKELITALGPFRWVAPFRTVAVFAAEGGRAA